MNNDIVLSVCLITYNHARFLPKALEGILMQHVNFPIEIVVGDDCSSDNSIEIIRQYALKSPFQFRILDYQTHYGMHKNWERTIRACQGKYVALLEGDDYWIDSNKLQTQVDILEQDLTLSVCCTNASVESDESIKRDDSYPYVTDIKNGRFTVQTIIRSNFIPTCTVVFRNGLLPKIMPGFFYTGKMVDVPIHTYNLLKGDGWFTDCKTSVYRLHQGGVWGHLNQEGRLLLTLDSTHQVCRILRRSEYQKIARRSLKDCTYKVAEFYNNNKQYIKFLIYRFRTWLAL